MVGLKTEISEDYNKGFKKGYEDGLYAMNLSWIKQELDFLKMVLYREFQSESNLSRIRKRIKERIKELEIKIKEVTLTLQPQERFEEMSTHD